MWTPSISFYNLLSVGLLMSGRNDGNRAVVSVFFVFTQSENVCKNVKYKINMVRRLHTESKYWR